MSANEKQSSTGKDMIALKLNVHADDGFDYHIFDNVSPEFMAYKLRHFAVAVGLEKKYEAGTITADDCHGREGYCDVIQKNDKQYGPKNAIKDYFQGKEKEVKAAKAPAPVLPAREEDDDVPF
jgi:hypothetical protein